jgi:spermidine/putrescine transport system substrate-binding protein
MTDTPLTRDELLRRSFAIGAALSIPGLWTELAGAGVEVPAAIDPKKLKKTLVFSNWPLYIDVDEKTKKHPSLDLFTKRYGVEVKYIEDINDNAQFWGKIQAPLSLGQSIGRDIIVMTDNSPYPALLVQKKWVEKLDKSVLTNIKNLQPSQRHPAWDKNRDYSLPWQSGMTGIGYNDKLTKPVTSIDQLLTDKKLHGKVTLLNSIGDTLGLVLLANGDNPAKVDDAAFNRALTKIQKAVKSGQVRQFTGNDYAPLMAKGDVWAATVWSGDMVQLQADNKHLRFTLPKTGGMLWTDNMLIPTGGDSYTASAYMNFYYDPKIAAMVEDYVNYICPVVGADKVLRKTDPSVGRNTLIFPTPHMYSQLHLIDPNALFNPDYKTKWQKVLGA